MTASVVGTSASSSTASATTQTLVIPTCAAGDIIVVACANQGTGAQTFSADRSFGSADHVITSHSAANLAVWVQVAVAGDSGATLTVTSSATQRRPVVCIVLRGVAATVDVQGSDQSSSNSNSVVAPAVTTTVDDDVLLSFHDLATSVARTMGTPTGFTAGPYFDTGANATGSALACSMGP